MIRRLAWFLCALLPLLSACGDGGTPTRENPFVPLTSLEIRAAAGSIAAGTTSQFRVFGLYSGIFERELTDRAQWISSEPTILTFSDLPGEAGLGKALLPGVVTVSASYQGFTAQVPATVTVMVLSSLVIAPASSLENPQVIPLGFTQQFTATGTFQGGATQDLTRDVTWASAAGQFSVGNGADQAGLVTPLEPGDAELIATFQGVTATAYLSLASAVLSEITIAPKLSANRMTMAQGTSQRLTATGHFTNDSQRDITAEVVWSVSPTGIATAGNDPGSEGLIEALIPGTTSVKATLGSVNGSGTLTVTNAFLTEIEVTLADSDAVIAVNDTTQASATGTFSDLTTQDLSLDVAWSTGDGVIATVNSAGLVRGLAAGEVEIIATLDAITSSTTPKILTVQ